MIGAFRAFVKPHLLGRNKHLNSITDDHQAVDGYPFGFSCFLVFKRDRGGVHTGHSARKYRTGAVGRIDRIPLFLLIFGQVFVELGQVKVFEIHKLNLLFSSKDRIRIHRHF